MPEAPTIVPAAPSARPAASGAPSAVPASSGEIHVTPPATRPTGTPEPKPGGAKAKMFEKLGEKSNANPRTAMAPTAPKSPEPAKAEAVKPAESAASPSASEPTKTGEPVSTTVDTKDVNANKKASPWKLVEEFKGKATKAEQELAELRKQITPENDRKAWQERIDRAEARSKQLEEHMTYVDYSQTEDFKQKYDAPYDKAWKKAMAELTDIKIADGQGGERNIHPQDLLTIINAPLAKARQMADEAFGSFANDVMAHRNEIRNLYDKRDGALEEVKKNGLAKKQQEAETYTKNMAEMTKNISATWQQENDAVLKDEKYGHLFKPREGDEHWNQRLSKGYELVDKAFSQNPGDPKLTPEERASVIRRHAAVRNRAAAWGALRGEVEALTASNKALNEELKQYKDTEPPGGAGRSPNASTAGGAANAKASMFEALKKKAR
jgi:hypothetical protein